jgi:hypothetical protein
MNGLLIEPALRLMAEPNFFYHTKTAIGDRRFPSLRNSFPPDITRLVPESPYRLLHPYLGRLAHSSFCRHDFFETSTMRLSSGDLALLVDCVTDVK